MAVIASMNDLLLATAFGGIPIIPGSGDFANIKKCASDHMLVAEPRHQIPVCIYRWAVLTHVQTKESSRAPDQFHRAVGLNKA